METESRLRGTELDFTVLGGFSGHKNQTIDNHDGEEFESKGTGSYAEKDWVWIRPEMFEWKKFEAGEKDLFRAAGRFKYKKVEPEEYW